MAEDLSAPEPRQPSAGDTAPSAASFPKELPKWLIGATLGGVTLVATVIFIVLILTIHSVPMGNDQLIASTFDAIKIASGIIVSGGGILALYLAVRRQRTTEADLRLRDRTQTHNEQVALDNRNHQERLAIASEKESLNRQVTELYMKSVEQLGAVYAPVRLGAMYALERLANENVEQRQTVINVLAAYLRMPFTLPSQDSGDHAKQELQVRNTAQRILQSRLRGSDFARDSTKTIPNPLHWGSEFDLDLSGATLIDLNLMFCAARHVNFRDCTFVDEASFQYSKFSGRAHFWRATFTEEVSFNESSFSGSYITNFNGAIFEGVANFHSVKWSGPVEFARCIFKENLYMSDAKVMGAAWFKKAKFLEDAQLGYMDIGGAAFFEETEFNGELTMWSSIFRHGAKWDGATFHKTPDLRNAIAVTEYKYGSSVTKLDDPWPDGWRVDAWPSWRNNKPDETHSWGILVRATDQ